MENKIIQQIFDEFTTLPQLEWDEEYRTSEALKMVIDNGSKIKSSLQCEKVCWFLFHFTQNAAGRSIACTSEVVDFIVHLLKDDVPPTSTSIALLGFAICAITACAEGQRLFSTSEAVAAIINALNSDGTTVYVGLTVASITSDNPEGQRLFSTPETVSAIINAVNTYATTPESAHSLSWAISNITFRNPEGQLLFSSPEAASAIINVLTKHATTPESVQRIGRAIANIACCNPEGQRLFSSPEAVSAIINAFTKYATTPESVQNLGSAIISIAFNNPDGKRHFSTPEAASAIINALNKYATTPDCVKSVGGAIRNIVDNNPESQRLFSTPEVASAFTNALNKYATTPESVQYLGGAVGNIVDNNPESQRLFSTPEVASAFTNALNKYATTPESVVYLAFAVGNIVANNPEGQRLFSTPEAVSAIINALDNSGTTESVVYLGSAFGNIALNNPEGQRLFSTPEAVSAIITALIKFGTAPESVEFLGFAIASIARNNPECQRLFSTPEVASAFTNALNKYATTPESVGNLGFAIASIAKNNPEGQRVFSTPEAVSAIINALNRYAKTPESVQRLSTAITNLTDNNPRAQQLFSTPESAAVIVRLLNEYSSNPDSVVKLVVATCNMIQDNTLGKQLFAKDNLMSLIGSMLERASIPNCLGALLILFASLRDETTTTIDSAIIRSAVTRTLPSDFAIDGNAAEHLVGIFSLGNEFSEAACTRDILRRLEQFVASGMRPDYPQKQHVLAVIPKISSRLVSRFQKWLHTLMEKHNFDNKEEKLPEEMVKLLFEQELDETTSLRFFDSLEQVPSEIKTLLKKLIEAEKSSTIPDSNQFSNLLHRLTEEFGKKNVFAPSDITYGHDNRGTGTYGSVRIASIISQQHKHVAAKMFKDTDHGIAEAKNYLSLTHLHLHITNFIGVTIDPQTLGVGLLLELADRDFSRVINSSAASLSVNKIKKFSLQIASGLEYLHKKQIHHLDLKPQNILVFQQGKDVTVKLADFGSMLETEKTFTEKAFVAGTELYLPPEHHAARKNKQLIPVSATFDIFAFGVILMEMLIWNDEKRKKKIKEIENVKEKVKNGEIIFLDSEACCINDDDWREDVLSDENGRKLIAICKKCLMIDPTKRYSDGAALVRALKDLVEDEEDILKKQQQRDSLRAIQEISMLKAQVNEDISHRNNTLNEHHETLASKPMPTSQRFRGESVSLSFHAIDEFPSNTKQNNNDDDE